MLNFKSCAPAKANVSTFKNSEFVSRIGGERNKEKEEREDETNEIRIPCFFPRDSFLHSPPSFPFLFFLNWKNIFTKYPGETIGKNIIK